MPAATITGTFVGTGALITVSKEMCGFKPRKVEIFNATQHTKAVWTDDMAAASAQKTVANGTCTDIASGGITPLDGGFTLGTDGDLNASGNVIHFEATR